LARIPIVGKSISRFSRIWVAANKGGTCCPQRVAQPMRLCRQIS
jgi:hypothetical protein